MSTNTSMPFGSNEVAHVIQIHQGSEFPLLTSPDFNSVLDFKKALNDFRRSHRSALMPHIYELVNRDIMLLLETYGFEYDSEEKLFRSLFALTRPQFAAERVHLLERIVFSGEEALRQSPFALLFRLQEYISRFTLYADALELPIELVTRQFQASLLGGFGRMVADELRGPQRHLPSQIESSLLLHV